MTTTLQFLLENYPPELFIETKLDKEYLNIKRRNKDYYKEIITLEDIDEFISFMGDSKNIRIKKDYRDYDSIHANNTYQMFNKSASITLFDVSSKINSVKKIQKNLERELFCKTSSSIFITPPSSQTVKKHYDLGGTFILQLKGSKNWLLYDKAIECPRTNDYFSPHYFPEAVNNAPLKESILLNEGDLLYIPRGFVHEAKTSDSYSIHLSLIFAPYTWDNLLPNILEDFLNDEPLARKILPIEYNKGLKSNEEMKKVYSLLLNKLLDNTKYLEVGTERLKQSQEIQSLNLNGRLIELIDLDTITINSEICVHQGMIYNVTQTEKILKIFFHNKSIEIPINTKEAFDYIIGTHRRFTLKEIPSMDEESTVFLVKFLVKEGFLQCNSIESEK